MSRYAKVEAGQIHVKFCPCCLSNGCYDRESNTVVSDWSGDSYVEDEPVIQINICGASQISFRDFLRVCSIHIDVETPSYSEISRKQGRCTLDNPTIVDEVEPFEKTVISHLSLELLNGPL